MYGYDLSRVDGKGEMKPTDLWVTYMVADKYLVEELKFELILGTMTKLNKFNVCLLYDQFLEMPFDKIGGLIYEKTPFKEFEKFIQAYSKAAFESESFLEIETETLVRILSFEFLNLPELDVLKACFRWVNAEIERLELVPTAENKRKVFVPIKSFVRLTDLGYEQFGELSELKEVLSPEEYASLLWRFAGKCDKIATECKTERKVGGKVYGVKIHPNYQNENVKRSNFTVILQANQKVCITSIQTTITSLTRSLELKVFKYEESMENYVQLPFLEFATYLVEKKWCLEPGRALEIDPHVNYKFIFDFAERLLDCLAANYFVTYHSLDRFELSLKGFNNNNYNDYYHCIAGLNFCRISN